MIQFTLQQQQAFDLIIEAASQPRNVFVLHGLAGTGKTTVLAEVARTLPDATLSALTGKAASVLSRKTGVLSQTIHSVFYQLIGHDKDDKGRKRLYWSNKVKDDYFHRSVVLIDECSMVDDRMAEDILRTGATIIACGDPGQLPPVRGRQFFSQPDFVLTEILRQAQESPIIRQAHAIRTTGAYSADGPLFRVEERASRDDIMDAGVILCWKNKTKDAANRRVRDLRGTWMPNPQRGEPVVCLKNNSEHGLFNGAIYELAEPFLDGDSDIHLRIDGKRRTIPNSVFRGIDSSLDPDDDAEGYFDYGYALTVHKAQGSEWPSVVLIDEYNRSDQRRQWLYTGVTRASERILILG